MSSGSSTAIGHYAYWLTVTATLLSLVDKDTQFVVDKSSSGGGAKVDATPSAAAAKIAEFKHKLADRFDRFSDRFKLLKRGDNKGDLPPSPLPARGASGDGTACVAATPTSSAKRASGSSGGGAVAASAGSDAHLQAGPGPEPARAFRHALDLQLQQCYSAVRDALKRQLTGILPDCIQAPLPPSEPTSPVPHGSLPTSPEGANKSAFGRTAEATRMNPGDDAKFTLGDDDEEEGGGASSPPRGQGEGAAAQEDAGEVGSTMWGLWWCVCVEGGGRCAYMPGIQRYSGM